MPISFRKFLLFRGQTNLALYYPGGVKSLTPFARLCFPFPPFIPRLKKGLPRCCGRPGGSGFLLGSEVHAVADGAVHARLVGIEVGVHIEEDGAGILRDRDGEGGTYLGTDDALLVAAGADRGGRQGREGGVQLAVAVAEVQLEQGAGLEDRGAVVLVLTHDALEAATEAEGELGEGSRVRGQAGVRCAAFGRAV